MRTPQQLARRQLLAIVEGLQQALYLDIDSQETKIWNPDKSWDGAEICDYLANLLNEYGLVPQTMTAVDTPRAPERQRP